jgi:hypothetical protein
MVYTPAAGDYVSWKEGTDNTVRYGVITAVSSSNYKVKPYEPNDKETKAKGIKEAAKAEYKEIAKSNWAKMKMTAKPNMIEVAENFLVAGGYHALIKKNKLFGAEAMSFLMADVVHEFLTKSMAIKFADMFKPYELKKDSGDIFQSADLWDSAQKLPFVTGFQQIFQHFVFRKPLNHQIMSNVMGNAGIFYVSNVGDRMWYGDDAKTPAYRYK